MLFCVHRWKRRILAQRPAGGGVSEAVPPMNLSRHELNRTSRQRLHAGRNATKATIDLLEIEGRQVVLKDLSERSWFVRELIGPWQLNREVRAYARLDGLPGVPRLFGRVDRQAIALEYVPGTNLGSLNAGDLPEEFFVRLERLIEAVHGRGVAHGDLNRSDVLAGPDGAPYVIDFSTAFLAGRFRYSPRSRLFTQACRVDRRSVVKLRRRFFPASRVELPDRRGIHRLGRWLKRLVNLPP